MSTVDERIAELGIEIPLQAAAPAGSYVPPWSAAATCTPQASSRSSRAHCRRNVPLEDAKIAAATQ